MRTTIRSLALVIHILRRAQHPVLRARDGAECLELFRKHSATIALVLLDCRLPDADGMALCRFLQQHSPELPVLLTSGRDYSQDAVMGDVGATAFLRKPFRPAEVESKVMALLGAIA